MSESLPTLEEMLAASDLADKAVKVDASMYKLQWGSAIVIVGISGAAIVTIAPMFHRMPEGKEAALCRRLLEYNAAMGGTAAFAIQPDGWVVLQAGRGLKGMDGHEFAVMVGTVGRFADDLDDKLYADFYAGGNGDVQRPRTPTVDLDVTPITD
jgi:putative sensory transduction regulator